MLNKEKSLRFGCQKNRDRLETERMRDGDTEIGGDRRDSDLIVNYVL